MLLQKILVISAISNWFGIFEKQKRQQVFDFKKNLVTSEQI